MKSNKEIERKWLINGYPSDETPFTEGTVRQAYISIDPEVRIREATFNGKPVVRLLTIKSSGTMVRDEIEVRISKDQYDSLLAMAKYEPIEKEVKKYQLENDHVLECCNVDPGKNTNFMYAEVEFENEGSASGFGPLPIFTSEVTSDSSYKMKNYWVRTRMNASGTEGSNKEPCSKDETDSIPDGLNDCLNKMGPFGEFLKSQIKDGNMKVVNPEEFNPIHFLDDKSPEDIAKFTALEVAKIHQHLDDFGFNEAQLSQIERIIHDEGERLFAALNPSQTFTWPNPIEGEECIAHGIGKIKTGLTKKKAKKLIKKMIEEYLDKFIKSKKLKKKIRKIAIEEACKVDLGVELSDLEERIDDLEEHIMDEINDAKNCGCKACECHDNNSGIEDDEN